MKVCSTRFIPRWSPVLGQSSLVDELDDCDILIRNLVDQHQPEATSVSEVKCRVIRISVRKYKKDKVTVDSQR